MRFFLRFLFAAWWRTSLNSLAFFFATSLFWNIFICWDIWYVSPCRLRLCAFSGMRTWSGQRSRNFGSTAQLAAKKNNSASYTSYIVYRFGVKKLGKDFWTRWDVGTFGSALRCYDVFMEVGEFQLGRMLRLQLLKRHTGILEGDHIPLFPFCTLTKHHSKSNRNFSTFFNIFQPLFPKRFSPLQNQFVSVVMDLFNGGDLVDGLNLHRRARGARSLEGGFEGKVRKVNYISFFFLIFWVEIWMIKNLTLVLGLGETKLFVLVAYY